MRVARSGPCAKQTGHARCQGGSCTPGAGRAAAHPRLMPAAPGGARPLRLRGSKPGSSGESALHGGTGLSEQLLPPPATSLLSVYRRCLLQPGDPWLSTIRRTSCLLHRYHAAGSLGGTLPHYTVFAVRRQWSLGMKRHRPQGPKVLHRAAASELTRLEPCTRAGQRRAALQRELRVVPSPRVQDQVSARDQPCQGICLLSWSMLYLPLGSTISHTLRRGRVCRRRFGRSGLVVRQPQ